ncbi:bleomycin resistance protein [Azospirillum argentinense]|uniref:Bleomycin resistance protein n=1 Tax=Azospirillum argentinense TaxID=2970906 RepID=A0ABW8VFD1_9PROT
MAVEFERVTPILPVRDVRAALAHYRRLGFEASAYTDTDEDPFYGFLAWGDVTLHLTRVPNLEPARSTVACYLYVNDADALYAAWQAAKVDGRLTAPADTPYHYFGSFCVRARGKGCCTAQGVTGAGGDHAGGADLGN